MGSVLIWLVEVKEEVVTLIRKSSLQFPHLYFSILLFFYSKVLTHPPMKAILVMEGGEKVEKGPDPSFLPSVQEARLP